MNPSRKSALLRAIEGVAPAALEPERDPVASFTALRNVCRGSGELPPRLAAWIAGGLDTWLAGGVTLEEAFRLKARRGDRFDTPHARSRRTRRDQALFVALAEIEGDAWQKAGTLERALAGEGAAPGAKVEELRGLVAAGEIALPRTQAKLYAVIASVTSLTSR